MNDLSNTATSAQAGGERFRFRGTLLHRIVRNPVGLQGLLLMSFMLLTAVFAGVITSYDPAAQESSALLKAPSVAHLLGTDNLGRDVLTRLAYGARLAWLVGLVSVGIGATAGVAMGLAAGYFGRVVDEFIMRFVDILLAFPGLILQIAIVGILGPSLANALIAIGIGMTPRFARVTRSQVLSIKEMDYILAARALGAPDRRILARYILPNIMPTLIVLISLSFSTAILAESSLSFLGLGAQPPEPSWGSMLNLSRQYMELAPWLAIGPGVAIMISVLGFNQLGDGLRDILDPRMRGRL